MEEKEVDQKESSSPIRRRREMGSKAVERPVTAWLKWTGVLVLRPIEKEGEHSDNQVG